ncbi:unnamed protein product [Peniophora sp. CBMAI 1063]|nr:unnamed protein product [Peniophora sp. CBMAI 1063]
MPLTSFLWQSAKGVSNVGALYRHQCIEALRICRNLKSERSLQRDGIGFQILMDLACLALDCAARDDPKAEAAFLAFDEAVDGMRHTAKLSVNIANNMATAKIHDDAAAHKHQSVLAKLSFHNEAGMTPFGRAVKRSLYTFFVAPCEDTTFTDVSHLLQFAFHVEHTATLPELIFRFHRKHRQRWSEKLPFQPLRFPHFYAKTQLDRIDEEVVRPLDNHSMDTLASEEIIWAYGDNPRGHYELVRGMRRSRIRSISVAPARDGLCRVFRDICGHLATERFLFCDVFSRWVEDSATLLHFQPSGRIREDGDCPGRVVIEPNQDLNTVLVDIAIAGIVEQEVVSRTLETSRAPYDGYVTETMLSLQIHKDDDHMMPGGLSPSDYALLAVNPLTRQGDWWGFKAKLTEGVAHVKSRFWRRSRG